MILIADSGSTKTSWCLAGGKNKTEYFSTGGINPFFRSTEDIENELREKLVPEINTEISYIHFYGAGIINAEKGNVVKQALQNLFPVAEIEVESDLLAAARATLQHERGIACILGTGSNSCLYDGKGIVQHIRPLGFVLGDEGSGAVLGRKLLGDYLKGILPAQLSEKFHKQFPLSYPEFLEGVYKRERPNRFLAQFVPFLKENIKEEHCKFMVESSLDEFVQRNISQYPGFGQLPICFVGSVAFHFQEQLRNVLKKYHIPIKIVLKEPLNGLLDYHTEK